jgi:hypothetical protein
LQASGRAERYELSEFQKLQRNFMDWLCQSQFVKFVKFAVSVIWTSQNQTGHSKLNKIEKKIFPSLMLVNKELQKVLKNILPKNTTKLEIRYYALSGQA